MKVGILTFHRACNYGAVLQCFALQEVIRNMGHYVAVIDYVDDYTNEAYKTTSSFMIRHNMMSLKSLLRYLIRIPSRAKSKKNFSDFVNKYLNVTQICNCNTIPQDFEVYVIGSDQLWGLSCLGGKEDPVYMGCFKHPECSKIIGYAISTNKASLETIGAEKLKRYSNNFYSLSFREQSNVNILTQLVGLRVHLNIDPTLLPNTETWNSLINDTWKERRYVLTYQVRGAKDDLMRRKAKKLANKEDLMYFDMTNSFSSVTDFVSAIKYAQCVITTSFHATVFSLIFKKKFWAIVLNDGHDARYVDLLCQIGASETINDLDFPVELPPNLDYNKIDMNLRLIREKSLKYLRDSF